MFSETVRDTICLYLKLSELLDEDHFNPTKNMFQ